MTTVIILCHPDRIIELERDLEHWCQIHPDYEVASQGETEKQQTGVIILECDHSDEPPLWLSIKLSRDRRVIDYLSYDADATDENDNEEEDDFSQDLTNEEEDNDS